jgi:hypothetical protein
MQTPFDWVTIALFAGLVVLLLQRSSMQEPSDKLWQYVPPAIGCATVNYLGNNGHPVLAVGGLILVIVYIIIVLKPHVIS